MHMKDPLPPGKHQERRREAGRNIQVDILKVVYCCE